MNNAAKYFDIPATNLNVLHNYIYIIIYIFDNWMKLFLDLYLIKFLDIANYFRT